MVIHNLVFLTQFLCKLEKKSCLKWRIFSSLSFLLSFFVVAEGIMTASFVRMKIFIIVISFHELIIDVHSFPKRFDQLEFTCSHHCGRHNRQYRGRFSHRVYENTFCRTRGGSEQPRNLSSSRSDSSLAVSILPTKSRLT